MCLPINIHFSVIESGILLGGCTEGSVGEYGGEEFGGGEKIGQGQLKVWKPNWAIGYCSGPCVSTNPTQMYTSGCLWWIVLYHSEKGNIETVQDQ